MNVRYFNSIILLLAVSSACLSQSKDTTDLKEYYNYTKLNYRANFFTPGVEVEMNLTKDITMNHFIGYSWHVEGGECHNYRYGFGLTGDFVYRPSIRYYYNFKRRMQKGKSIRKFSGNTIELQYQLPYNYLVDRTKALPNCPSITRPSLMLLTLMYGWQRSFLKDYGYIHLSAGPTMTLRRDIYNDDHFGNRLNYGVSFNIDVGVSFEKIINK
jgi:hypothetical protein